MTNQRIIILVIGLLAAGNAFFAVNYYNNYKESREDNSAWSESSFNQKVVNFMALFVKKVLQADQEVDFETRLSLENSVRDLKDEQIMAAWQDFVGSQTEAEAQESVKKLLEILISKIQ